MASMKSAKSGATMRSGVTDAAQATANNLAYQRYKQANKKKGMTDEEAVDKSSAIMNKLRGVMKSTIEKKI